MKKIGLLIFALFCLGITNCQAQYTVLLNFNYTNGAYATNSFIISGNKLFGMTTGGGLQYGTIFSIDTDGSSYKDMHEFWAYSNPFDGGFPYYSSLTFSVTKDTLFGMTEQGGPNHFGNIFRIDSNGAGFINMFDFGGPGICPQGNGTLSGNKLYGMTGVYNPGTIFSINTNGSGIRTLLLFNDTNGSNTNGNLTLIGGLLYGMAQGGGAHGYGCIFHIDTNGSRFTDIYDFNAPYGGLGQSLTLSGSKFYGMISPGGVYDSGCIFCIDTNGSGFKDIFDFNGPDGKNPGASLTLSGSKLFGLTPYGGPTENGVAFSLDTDGTHFKDLFYFGGANGSHPYGSLAISGSSLYGMTYDGVTEYEGVIFKLDTANNITTSINNLIPTPGSITIYPNPSNGIFTIQTSVVSINSSIEIYNVLGEKVYSHYQITKSLNYQIDLSSNPDGLYLYRVLAENGEFIGEGKVVIQK